MNFLLNYSNIVIIINFLVSYTNWNENVQTLEKVDYHLKSFSYCTEFNVTY